MLDISYTSKFKKDYKSCKKRGYDMFLLEQVVSILATPATLPSKNRDHGLVGNYANKRECHISPDWLLVYKIDGDELILYRTGTHADIFEE